MVFGAEKDERFDWTRFDVSMTPDTTLVVHKNSDNLVGSEFTVSGDAIAAGGLNRVYVQLVHRETSTRYGGTTINLIGKGTSASWSRLYKAAADGLPEGTYAAHVAVVDMAGRVTNVGWTENFILDKTDATFDIRTPANNSLVRGVQRVSARIIDTNDITKVLMNVGDGAGNYVWEAGKSNNKVTRDGDIFYLDVDTTTLLNGVNYVVLRATDGAGNTRYFNNNANTRVHSYIVDNESPTAEIVAPSLANSDVTIKGVASDNHGIKSHWFEVKAPNGKLYYKNFSSNSATEVTFNLSEASRIDSGIESFTPLIGGKYTIRYVVTDLAGNRNDDPGYTNSEIHTLTIDKTRPVVALLSPTQSVFNSIGVLLKVQATDNIAVQKVVTNIYKDGVLFKSTQSTAPVDAADYTHSVDLGTVLSGNPLPEGTYYVKYNALDTAGNISETKTFDFKVDTTGPTVTVKPAPETVGSEALGIYSKVSFKLFDANKVDKLTLNGIVKDLTDNNWSDLNGVKPGTFGAVEGTNTLIVYDVSGNSTTLVFTLDATAPTVPTNLTWTTSASASIANGGSTNDESGVASWSASVSSDVSHYIYKYWNDIPGNPYKEVSPWANSLVSGTSLPGVFNQGEGVHYFSIAAVDYAGNVSASSVPFKITFDTTAPIVTVNPIINSTNTAPTITGTTSELGGDVTIFLDSGAGALVTSNAKGEWSWAVPTALSVGPHMVIAVATDAAGNSSASDTTSPQNYWRRFIVQASSSRSTSGDRTGTGAVLQGAAGNTALLATGGGATDGTADVLAVQDDSQTDTTGTVDTDEENSQVSAAGVSDTKQGEENGAGDIFGLAWYWWLVILAVIAALWWFIAARRRRGDDKN